MRVRRLVLVLIACAVSVVIWFLIHGGARSTSIAPISSEEVRPSQALSEQRGETLEVSESKEDRIRTTALAAAPMGFRVVESGGADLVGAEVTWSSIASGEIAAREPRSEADRMRTTIRGSVKEDGLFHFDEEPESAADGTVMWITHPGHLAQRLLLPADKSRWSVPARIELERSRGVLVSVRGRDPAAADTVRVVQTLRAPQSPGESNLADTPGVLAALMRTYDIGGDGRVHAAALPGDQVLFAQQGSLRSDAWYGRHPAEVELVLRPTFMLGGRVIAEPGGAIDGARIHVLVRTDGEYRRQGREPVQANGAWGPVDLPTLERGEYVVRLDGGGFVPEEVTLGSPEPLTRRTVVFHPRSGIEVAVHVVERGGGALAGAAVSGWFRAGAAGDEWIECKATTDAEGIAALRTCPTGQVWVSATHKGFARRALDPFELYQGFSEQVEVVLDPAGRIEGRCLHGGQPVESFVVTYLPGSSVAQSRTLTVRDSRDGRFAVEEAPLGEVAIFASTKELPPSRPIFVEVAPDEPAKVDIELPSPVRGRGRVVDALTAEPIREATIQLYESFEYTPLGPWGGSVPVDRDGAFVISGLVEGQNLAGVSAPGYASARPRALVSGEGEVDFGVISLLPLQRLEVRLLMERDPEPLRCRAVLSGAEDHPLRAFDERGVAVFDAVAPGQYRLQVILDDSTCEAELDLRAGKPWLVEIPVRAERSLAIEVVPRPGEHIPSGCMLRVACRGSIGKRLDRWSDIPPSGLVEIERPAADRVVLEAYAGERYLASKAFDLGSIGADRIRIDIDGVDRKLRVVDGDAQPIAMVRVFLQLPGDGSGWYRGEWTNGDGECLLTGISARKVLVTLIHHDLGIRAHVPVEFTDAPGEPVMLELDARAELGVALHDGDVPLSGVPLRFEDEVRSGFSLADVFTDTRGIATFGPVSDGQYFLEIDYPGLWPVGQLVEATRGGVPTPIQVRRLGSASLTVGRLGAPLSGLPVDLRSLEFDTDVSQWISEERAKGAPADLRTDSDGQVRFEGIPRGAYAWRVRLPNGEEVTGTCEVPPWKVVQVEARVP